MKVHRFHMCTYRQEDTDWGRHGEMKWERGRGHRGAEQLIGYSVRRFFLFLEVVQAFHCSRHNNVMKLNTKASLQPLALICFREQRQYSLKHTHAHTEKDWKTWLKRIHQNVIPLVFNPNSLSDSIWITWLKPLVCINTLYIYVFHKRIIFSTLPLLSSTVCVCCNKPSLHVSRVHWKHITDLL